MSDGMRLIRRGTEFRTCHVLEMQPGDVDCTDMDDETFEREVRDNVASDSPSVAASE